MAPSPSPPAHRSVWPALLAGTCLALAASLAVLWLLGPDDGTSSDGVVAVDEFLGAEPSDGVDRAPVGAEDLGSPLEVGDELAPLLLEGLGGEDIDTGDLAGGVVVLNFWSSGCAPCVREMPLLEDAHQRLGDEITFVGVDVAEGEEPGRKMMERTGVQYPQTRDPSSAVLRRVGGLNLPYTVVVAADGTIAATHTGEIHDEDELMELLEKAR